MTSPVAALVYVSSAVSLCSDGDLIELLSVSRRNNARQGVTGLLLYKGGNFMQLLEGTAADVERTHGRIERDPRHRGLLTLLYEPVAERVFDDWSMAFGNLDHPEVAGLPGVSDFLQTSFTDQAFTAQPSRALQLLQSFKRSMR